MIGFFIAILSGLLMSLQGVFNTEVSKQSSMWASAGFVHLTAFFMCVLMWVVFERKGISGIWSVRPLYFLSGGLIGAFITYTVVVSMKHLGPAKAVIFIVAAQIASAYLIEALGLFGVEKTPVTARSLIGAAVTIAGLAIFRW
jgi:transporter family-2 protein